MEIKVFQRDGQETGRSVTLAPEVFGVEPNDHAIWLDVRRIQANARQGTHKTKERGDVAGSTRKLYRQKGTGFARAGSSKSPIRKTGGRTFGPRPRRYHVGVNKKTRRLARRSALTYKAQADAVRIVENLSFEAPSARDLVSVLQALNLEGQKVLLLTAEHEPGTYRSSNNVPRVCVREARNASTYDVLDAQVLLIAENALEVLHQQLAGTVNAA